MHFVSFNQVLHFPVALCTVHIILIALFVYFHIEPEERLREEIAGTASARGDA